MSRMSRARRQERNDRAEREGGYEEPKDSGMGRSKRRAFVKERRRVRPTLDQLIARSRDEDLPPEARALAREWQHFPGTRGDHVLARLNARSKRRAKAKRAKASRKANRRRK
jgi:hypothetical protein